MPLAKRNPDLPPHITVGTVGEDAYIGDDPVEVAAELLDWTVEVDGVEYHPLIAAKRTTRKSAPTKGDTNAEEPG